jgi:xanthosine utilization system XapX-like protein
MSAVIGVILAILAVWVLIKVLSIALKIIAVVVLIGLAIGAYMVIQRKLDGRRR